MLLMAKTNKTKATILNFKCEPDLREALEEFIARQLIPPSKAAVITTALQSFLTQHGTYPRPRRKQS